MICTHLRLLSNITILCVLFYVDVLTDIAILLNYYQAHELGFFGITCFAIFSSLLAQVLYSPLLSIYRDHPNHQISTPSCIFRLLLSALYLTPLCLLYKFLYLQCCRLAKGSRDELQLAKISDVDETHSSNSHRMAILNHIDEQQKQDPNMIDTSMLDSGILTQDIKYTLLRNMVDDITRFSFVKSCFQSSINIFVQIFVLGEYFLFKDSTRKSTKDTISLSGNDVLLFPDNTQEVYVLMVSTAVSFICLCTAAWSQVSDMVKSSPQSELNWCIPLLFRLRAILESAVRVLRFMLLSVVFGAVYGVYLMLVEIAWKYLVLSCCDSKRRKKRKRRRRQRRKSQEKSGYSGNVKLRQQGSVHEQGYAQMMESGKKKRGSKCECDMELHKGVASWMLFSRERFQRNPCMMRFTDVIVWTVIILAVTCLLSEYGHVGKLQGVCDEFVEFQNDCIPLEVIVAITALVVLLTIIYILSPSIFNLVSALDQDIFGNQQKLLVNGAEDASHRNGRNRGGMRIQDGSSNEDEYESDEDTNITVIDISQPVENPTMPKKPKRKYSNSNNLMLMSVDDEIGDDSHEFEYDYQPANQ